MFLENLDFHHIGIACNDLEKEFKYFSYLGYEQEGKSFIDPMQGIRGKFIISKNQPRMELLINYGEKGTLTPWLKRGVKMYHICYKTYDFIDSIKSLESIGAKIVIDPVKAVAFDYMKIIFLMLPNRLLIELVEQR